MPDLAEAPTGFLGVLQRSNDALMDRVREEQYAVAHLLVRAGVARQLVFLHLKQDLRQRELSWSDAANPAQVTESGGRTAYGVDRHVQELLAGVRTDLDAFSGVEAHALMADGYLIARHVISDTLRLALDAPLASDPPLAWSFLAVAECLAGPVATDRIRTHLEVASWRVGKSMRTVPSLGWLWRLPVRLGFAAALLFGALAGAWALQLVLLAAAILIVALSLSGSVARAWGWSGAARRLNYGRAFLPALLLAPCFAAAVAIHLRICTRLRMRSGAIEWQAVGDPRRPTDIDRRAA
jgi:hypothetical protein